MRQNYLIRLYDYEGNETEIRLNATRFQVDKVFYSLAYASNNCSYRYGEFILNTKIKVMLNRFVFES